MRVVVGDIQVERSVLPEDPMQATDATVHKVVEIAMGRYGARSAKIRALAINLMNDAGVADKDYFGMAQAIHNWVRDQIRYVKDPVNQETLSHPEETAFNSLAGDCDDKTTLEIALLASVGIQAWPVVIGTSPAAYSHIYLMVLIPQGSPRAGVYPADPIMREWAFGREAPASVIKLRKEYPQLVGVSMRGIGAYMVGPAYLDETKTAQASIDARAARRAAGADSWDINAEVHPTNDGADGLFMAQPATAVEITRLGPITAFDAQQATRPLRGPKTVTVRADMHTTGDETEALQGLGMAPMTREQLAAWRAKQKQKQQAPTVQAPASTAQANAAVQAKAQAQSRVQALMQQAQQVQMQLVMAVQRRMLPQAAMLQNQLHQIQMQLASAQRGVNGLGAAPTGEAEVQDLYSRIPQAKGPTAQSQVLWLRHLAPLVQARYAPKLRASLGPIPREPAAAVQKAMVEIDEMVRSGTPPANAIATVIDAKVRADQAPTDRETGAPSYEFGPNSIRKTSNRIW